MSGVARHPPVSLSRTAHVFVVLGLAAPGCGVPLFRADLQPVPRLDGALQVEVRAAGATSDLLRAPSEGVQTASVVALGLEVRNPSSIPQTLEVSTLKLRLGRAGEAGASAPPASAGLGTLPAAIPEGASLGPVVLAPNESASVWVAFSGFPPSLAASTGEAILVVPGAPEKVVTVAGPVGPGPRWLLRNRPFVMNLRAALSEPNTAVHVQFETLAAYRSLVFGGASSIGGTGGVDEDQRWRPSFGVGLRMGWLPRQWHIGPVVGVDGFAVIGSTRTSPAIDEAYGLRFSAVLRWSSEAPVGLGGGVIPVEYRAPTPFTSFTVDVGYGYMLTRGPLKRGGGALVTVGAPLVFF
jgi:hypothetical protein